MTESILNFLTGGVFTTLKELIENVVQWIITFITNTTHFFLDPLINRILSVIPFIDDIGGKLKFVFDFVHPYISFILDISFISSPILIYLITSIIFRVSIRLGTYFVKLTLQWYHKLVP